MAAHMALAEIDTEKQCRHTMAVAGRNASAGSRAVVCSIIPDINEQPGRANPNRFQLAISLADALMSSDPEQMQSRLQPYQAWTQRFGAVLQKLALAVKDGNWKVKLNLNHSPGPVGVELQVTGGGIEGQIAASDPNIQLLGDS